MADIALIPVPILTGADCLDLCRDPATAQDLPEIAAQVARRAAGVWRGRAVEGGRAARIGVVVLREERHGDGRELVIVASAGRLPGMFAAFLPLIRTLAARAGCRTIRAHNRRDGFMRLMPRAGFKLVERIWRCEA